MARDLVSNVVGVWRCVRIAWLSVAMCAVAAAAPSAPEYSVKAGYLLLFAQYVTWPDHAFATADSPLIIAVVGHDPFGAVLDETLRDQKIGTHPIELVRLREWSTERHVHMAFIASAHSREEVRWLATVRDRPMLVVADGAELLDDGAAIGFVLEMDRLRYEVNVEAATRSQLQILSPMLVSARRVRGVPADSSGSRP